MNVPYPYALGVGQTLQPYVSMTYAMDHPLLVSLSLAPVIGTVQDTVTIPTNSYSAYFTVKATAAGAATVTATAPGWVAGAGTITFTPPQLGASGTTSMVAGDPSRGSWYASTEDSILRYSHPVADTVVVTATSRDPTVVAVDSAIGKVVPGQGTVLVYNALRAQPAAGGRSAWIVLTSPPSYRPDSFLVSVMAPALTFKPCSAAVSRTPGTCPSPMCGRTASPSCSRTRAAASCPVQTRSPSPRGRPTPTSASWATRWGSTRSTYHGRSGTLCRRPCRSRSCRCMSPSPASRRPCIRSPVRRS